MTEALLRDPQMTRAVSNIQPRSERQPDLDVLEKTYVDTGVLPQLQNDNNQILYGRRGTGKSHIFRVLGLTHDREVGRPSHLYVDVRLLGSAQLMTDPTQPLTLRCISVFRDLLSEIQNFLLDVATDPSRDGTGLEQVSDVAEALTHVTHSVREREVTVESSARGEARAHLDADIGTSGVGVSAGLSSGSSDEGRLS